MKGELPQFAKKKTTKNLLLTSYLIILNGGKTRCFPTKIACKTRTCPPTTPFQHCTRNSSPCSKTVKENERHADWEERNKSVLFGDDTIVYVENPKELTNSWN